MIKLEIKYIDDAMKIVEALTHNGYEVIVRPNKKNPTYYEEVKYEILIEDLK